MPITRLTTVTGLSLSTATYDAVFTSLAGWTVAHKSTGDYDIYNTANQLVVSNSSSPFIPGMDTDPRDCLGYIPITGAPPPVMMPSSESVIKVKSDLGVLKNTPVKRGGFVTTTGGWTITYNPDNTFKVMDALSGSTSAVQGTPHTPEGDWYSAKFPPKPGFKKP